jgi:formylglycine-generating enzyme required for sulfatase activity/tRNA A-37 threonylcarbamoyl transferase component Bud32
MQNQILQYTIIRELGQGGMAIVYLAEHQLLRNKVAVKVLNAELAGNSNIRNRFLAEARNMARMSHLNVIKVTDLIETPDLVAFVMEYIEGESLKEYIERKGALGNDEIKIIFSQMLAALSYVHENNLVHRDIKPSNFMIDKEGRVKLMDFGIAKSLDATASEYTQTATGTQMGTPMYMSPEQVRSSKEVGPTSDIYAMGVVLWQMVSGRPPYNTQVLSLVDILIKIIQEPLEPTHTVWDSTIQRASAKEPNNRFSDAKVFLQHLNNVVAQKRPDADKTLLEEIEIKAPGAPENPMATHSTSIDNQPHNAAPKQTQPNSNSPLFYAVISVLLIFIVGFLLNTNRGGSYEETTVYSTVTDTAVPKLESPLPADLAIDWAEIPGGTFSMGSPNNEAERSDNEMQHEVTLDGFKMSKYEVTFAQYDAFCDATGRSKPSDEGWGRGKRPVINVSWQDAKAYADWVGARLPTEAEWEYACRTGTRSPFKTGNCLSSINANYDGNYPYARCSGGPYAARTKPAGTYRPNAWGLYDMHGNVWEWCEDWYGDYPTLAQTNPQGPSSGSFRVIRGGSWSDDAQRCRSAYRDCYTPGNHLNNIGFRLVSPK